MVIGAYLQKIVFLYEIFIENYIFIQKNLFLKMPKGIKELSGLKMLLEDIPSRKKLRLLSKTFRFHQVAHKLNVSIYR